MTGPEFPLSTFPVFPWGSEEETKEAGSPSTVETTPLPSNTQSQSHSTFLLSTVDVSLYTDRRNRRSSGNDCTMNPVFPTTRYFRGVRYGPGEWTCRDTSQVPEQRGQYRTPFGSQSAHFLRFRSPDLPRGKGSKGGQ